MTFDCNEPIRFLLVEILRCFSIQVVLLIALSNEYKLKFAERYLLGLYAERATRMYATFIKFVFGWLNFMYSTVRIRFCKLCVQRL